MRDLIDGPRRDSVPVYATGPDSDWYSELGITGQKLSHRWTGEESDYDRANQRVAEVRQVLGPDADVMIDSYMTWTFDVSVEMAKRLRDLRVHWFEDVLTPDDLAGHAELRGRVRPTLVAGGEHEFTHHGFREIAQAGALDIWQPDIAWCGGITAGLRILDLANEAGVPVCASSRRRAMGSSLHRRIGLSPTRRDGDGRQETLLKTWCGSTHRSLQTDACS